MKKFILICISSIALIAIGLLVYFLFLFELFPRSEKRLAVRDVNGELCRVEVYWVGYGATTQDFIEVRQIYKSGLPTRIGTCDMHGVPDEIVIQEVSDAQVKLLAKYKESLSRSLSRIDTLIVNMRIKDLE